MTFYAKNLQIKSDLKVFTYQIRARHENVLPRLALRTFLAILQATHNTE